MTKKKYNKPLTAVVDIHADVLLLGTSTESLPIDRSGNPVTDPDGVYSRRYSNTWDEEEEEEEEQF